MSTFGAPSKNVIVTAIRIRAPMEGTMKADCVRLLALSGSLPLAQDRICKAHRYL